MKLNKALIAARSVEEMVQLVREAGDDGLNAVNAATALHQLAKRSAKAKHTVKKEDVELINKHVGRTLEGFKARELANTVWAWAKLGAHPGEELLRSVGRAVERKLGDFNPQAIANTVWAWATLGAHPGEELMRSVGRAVERKLGDFNPQDIANTVWACRY